MRSRQPFPRAAVLSHEGLLEALIEALELDDPEDRERLRERYFSALGISAGPETPTGRPSLMTDAGVTRLAAPPGRDPGHGDGPVDVPGARA